MHAEEVNQDVQEGVPQPADPMSQSLSLSEEAEPPAWKLESLLEKHLPFRLFWNQKPSALSLASIALDADWTEQETIDMLISWRRKHNRNFRADQGYYSRLIAQAREPINLYSDQGERAHLLRSLGREFGFTILRIVKSRENHPEFHMETALGEIHLGKVGIILSQSAFRKRVSETIGVSIPLCQKQVWDKRTQDILNACETERQDDPAPAPSIRDRLREYLQEKPPNQDVDAAAAVYAPLIENGCIHIYFKDFQKWLEGCNAPINVTIKNLQEYFGVTGTKPNVNVNNKRTTRTYWKFPEGWR